MNKIDHSDLDGRSLMLLLAVLEAGSVTGAAERLGVTQSAVSHGLDRLRAIVDDPLFVRAGRGITPTSRALALAPPARALLDGLRGFAMPPAFNPAQLELQLTVAANDLQRDLLLPGWLQRLRRQAPGLTLRVLPSGVPTADLLRRGECHLVLSPRPPDAADVKHRRLFEDRFQLFFDSDHRQAPRTRAEYEAADHVTVVYENARLLDVDQRLLAAGVRRRFVAAVPGFAGLAAFLQGGSLVATAPSALARTHLAGLANAPVPVACPRLPMYLIWHVRHQADPLHQWLRNELMAEADGLRRQVASSR